MVTLDNPKSKTMMRLQVNSCQWYNGEANSFGGFYIFGAFYVLEFEQCV